MINFEIIASSSAGCSYRVSGGGASRPLLLDAGVRFEILQKALDFKVSQLAGCLISHAHGDHCKSAAQLARNGVNIYSNRATLDALTGAHTHRLKEMTAGEWSIVGDWRVLPFTAVHDKETFGFVIGSPEQDRLLYLTDTCYSLNRFVGLTEIAIECNHSEAIMRENLENGTMDRERFARTSKNHLSIERLVETLKLSDLSKVRQIWLLHLSDQNSDAAAFKLAVERATGVPCMVADK